MQQKTVLTCLCFGLLTNLLFLSCSHYAVPAGSAGESKSGTVGISSPPCIVYRTRSDYSANVPVILSDDRSMIVSFPDIKDIYFNGTLSRPTRLTDGYLLDNRGIGPMVAFLSYTYEDYSRLASTPSVEELMNHIIDKDPLAEMYQCGLRSSYSNAEQELNVIITSGKLQSFKKLK
jgi:hypothetical protein